MGVAHSGPPRGPSHAGRRGHHRSPRPGIRQRRRNGDRRAGARGALRVAGRRPPHIRDRRRRLLHGRRVARGRLTGRTPGLGKLICIYDNNHITIDGATELAYSDDVAERFRAYHWDVVDLGEMANDMDGLERALLDAKAVTDRPSLLILRSHIGYPSPDHTDDHEAHGLAFDADDVTRTRAVMGIPDEPFWAPPELVEAYRKRAAANGASVHHSWADDNADTIASPEWQAAWSSTGLPGWL